jgi:hypothetical protein
MGKKCFGRNTMSRVLNILVEGQTEKEFVQNNLYPFFFGIGISNIRTITIETSPGFKGGDVRYVRYKSNVEQILKGKEELLITSLIDFYRLRNDFPKYYESKTKGSPQQRVDFLEKACAEDIDDNRFIPYIQLHEFEGLLFSDKKGFDRFALPNANKNELLEIIASFPNPELINEGTTTAPSKRLKRLIPEYNKPFHGPIIAMEIGFDLIMEKCPRFKNWIEILIQRMKAV